MFTKFLRIFHTVKYLKFKQIYYRLFYRFRKLQALSFPDEIPVCANWQWNGPAFLESSLIGPSQFKFLSHLGEVNTASDWNNPAQEKLWLYNLHYFDDLNAIENNKRKELHVNLINKWIDENPACEGNGWEPYPLSLRIVNWIKWISRQDTIEPKWPKSLSQQGEALSKQLEYHILGNHLFANGKALTFLGAFFPNELGTKFLNKGLEILDEQIPEQFLGDGAHFELSPMYHEILLWDLLELIELAQTSRHPSLIERVVSWKKTAEKAIYWLQCMVHPDGEISFFNDAAIGIAASPEQIYSYGKKLGLNPAKTNNQFIVFPESGYSRINQKGHVLMIDHANVGPDYLPGHAHADTLSFEWSVGLQRVLVNSGTSVYGVGPERLRQRKTRSHNSVEINNKDSSDVWGGFRVGKRAFSKLLASSFEHDVMTISAEHNGYKNVRHQRNFTSTPDSIKIEDMLTGSFTSASGFYHLHPDIRIHSSEKNSIVLILPEGPEIKINSSSPMEIMDSTWHPEFGKSVINKLIKMNFLNRNECITFTIIVRE